MSTVRLLPVERPFDETRPVVRAICTDCGPGSRSAPADLHDPDHVTYLERHELQHVCPKAVAA